MTDTIQNAEYRTFLGALIGLARTIDSDEQNVVPDTWVILAEGLLPEPESMTATALRAMTDRLHDEHARLSPQCALCTAPCGRKADCDISALRDSEEAQRLKREIFTSARGIAAGVAGHRGQDDAENRLLLRAVFSLGEDWDEEFLREVAKQCEEKSRHS